LIVFLNRRAIGIEIVYGFAAGDRFRYCSTLRDLGIENRALEGVEAGANLFT